MNLTLLSGPAVEPLDLDDVKAHLRLDGDDEDALLASLITTSRVHVEVALGLALITQSWRRTDDCWPRSGVVGLMTRPVQSVDRIAVRGSDGTQTLVAASDYTVDLVSGRLAPVSGWPQPDVRLGGIEIDFTAGYGAAATDVPESIRQALRLLVAHWYEVRSPVNIGTMATRVPDTVSELLRPYRAVRL